MLQEAVRSPIDLTLAGSGPGYHFGVALQIPFPARRVLESGDALFCQRSTVSLGCLLPGLVACHITPDSLQGEVPIYIIHSPAYDCIDILEPSIGIIRQDLHGLLMDRPKGDLCGQALVHFGHGGLIDC